jgi:hypothetical protein
MGCWATMAEVGSQLPNAGKNRPEFRKISANAVVNPRGCDSKSFDIMPSSFLQNIKLSKESIIILMILILMYFSVAVRHPIILILYVAFSFAFIILNIKYIRNAPRNFIGAATLIIVSCTLILPISMFRNFNVVFHYIILVTSIISAYTFYLKSIDYFFALRFSVFLQQFLLVVYLYFFGAQEAPLDNLFVESSSNGITSYLITMQICYTIASIVLFGRPTIITSILTLYISIIGFGRGSIITSFAIFVFNLIFIVAFVKSKWIRASGIIFSIFIFSIFITKFDDIFNYIFNMTKFSAGFFDVERYIINQDYINRLEGMNILIGIDYQNTVIERFYNGNPHNSFIRAHNIFGITYIFSIFYCIILAISSRMKFINRISVLVLISLLMFRAFTEPILFPTPFDAMFFCTLMIAAHHEIIKNYSANKRKLIPLNQ